MSLFLFVILTSLFYFLDFTSVIYADVYFTYVIYIIFLCLTYFASIVLSKCIHLAANDKKFHSFLWLSSIPLYLYSLYIFIY